MNVRHSSPYRLDELNEAVRTKMKEEDLSLVEAAGQLGVSAATLSRILSRKAAPSSSTFAHLSRWLGAPADRFLIEAVQAKPHEIIHYSSESTPQMVSAHLRADKNLTEDTADALIEAFKALYDHYSRQSRGSNQRGTSWGNSSDT